MKILYVIEHISTVGGLERILVEKMNALSVDPAFEVRLLTVWHDDAPVAFPLDSRVRHDSLDVPCPAGSVGMVAAMPRVLCRFGRYVRRFAPDVVVHFRAMGAMLAAFGPRCAYTVFEAHTARPHSNHRWLYRLMERRVDAVVCLTRGDAANYPRARRVEVIPNFTTLSPLVKKMDAAAPEAHLAADVPEARQGGKAPSHRCLFVGRLCPEKNPLRLLALWHDIVAAAPGWHLDIYGDGELAPHVREEIARLGLSGSVSMCGCSSCMPAVYAAHDMLLLTSLTEGLPMTIIEAMRCGLPVVSLDCPYGPADMIAQGETGFLVPQTDDAAFVCAVLTLMCDDTLRQSMGRKAMDSSLQYTAAPVMQRWKKLFLDR